jgi:CRP-like cAMP-binding protein
MPISLARKSSDKVAALRRTDLFGSLSEPVLKKLALCAMVRRFERGQILFSEHEEAKALYVIVEGEIRSVRQNSDGREQVLSVERAGAVLAAVPIFNGGRFYSTTIAASTAEVLCLQKRDVRQLCEEHRELLWSVARVLAEKVRHYAELIETLALRNVNQRVAQYVVTICEERGIPDQGGCIVEITMTRAELASRVGSTREVVSRAFGHLQTNGLIRLKGARLMMVPDLKTLKKFANAEHPLEKAKVISELSSEMA